MIYDLPSSPPTFTEALNSSEALDSSDTETSFSEVSPRKRKLSEIQTVTGQKINEISENAIAITKKKRENNHKIDLSRNDQQELKDSSELIEQFLEDDVLQFLNEDYFSESKTTKVPSDISSIPSFQNSGQMKAMLESNKKAPPVLNKKNSRSFDASAKQNDKLRKIKKKLFINEKSGQEKTSEKSQEENYIDTKRTRNNYKVKSKNLEKKEEQFIQTGWDVTSVADKYRNNFPKTRLISLPIFQECLLDDQNVNQENLATEIARHYISYVVNTIYIESIVNQKSYQKELSEKNENLEKMKRDVEYMTGYVENMKRSQAQLENENRELKSDNQKLYRMVKLSY